MFKISKLHLKNYVTYQDQIFDFDKLFDRDNIVLIYGKNSDDLSFANDNGSGKSIIYQALLWAVTGKTTRNTNGDLLIGNFAKSMSVAVTIFDNSGNKYWICRYRKHSVYANEVRLKINGKDKHKGKSREMTEFISELLGISYKRIINTSIFESDDERSRFIYLGDKEGKALLSQIKGFDVFQTCYDIAKKEFDEINKKLVEMKREIESKQTTITALASEYEDILKKEKEFIKEKEEKVRNIKDDIAKERKRMVNFSKDLKRQLNAKKSMLANLVKKSSNKDKIEKLEGIIEFFKENKVSVRIQLEQGIGRLKQEKLLLKQLEKTGTKVGKTCDYCGNVISEDLLEKRIASTKNFIRMEHSNNVIRSGKLDELQIEIARKNNELAKLVEKEKEHENEILNMKKYIERDKYELKMQLDNRNKNVERLIKSLKEVETEKNAFVATTKRLKENIDKLKDQVTQLEEKQNSLNEKLTYKEVWMKGFSKEELQTAVLRSTVAELNEEMQRISDILTDGTVTVELATEKQLRNKNIKNIFEFKISDINKKNLPFIEWSKGQKKRIEIIVSFALMNIEENIIQEVFLDELFDGIDETGMGKIKTLLESEATKRKRFVIFSHSKEIKSLFSNTAYIQLKNGVSTLHLN
jgi:DNA repair exonuclease SbcCD ATPase subunit